MWQIQVFPLFQEPWQADLFFAVLREYKQRAGHPEPVLFVLFQSAEEFQG
jgi:hypothetical protein